MVMMAITNDGDGDDGHNGGDGDVQLQCFADELSFAGVWTTLQFNTVLHKPSLLQTMTVILRTQTTLMAAVTTPKAMDEPMCDYF